MQDDLTKIGISFGNSPERRKFHEMVAILKIYVRIREERTCVRDAHTPNIRRLLMSTNPKYYLVEESALPEVFLKVAETKRLLSTGEATTVNEATHMTDISRSAFYKYRDAVLPFQNMMTGRIITFQLLVHDEPGQLSEILTLFAEIKANITTINSIVPTNGTAVITISASTSDMTISLDELMARLHATRGVVKAEILAG